MARNFVCRCEDATVEDVRRAFEKGYRDLESVKRYTGLGMLFLDIVDLRNL